MSTLKWSQALSVDCLEMDTTHREFVDLLAVVEAAADAQLLQAWSTLLSHTEQHFAQEDAWMRSAGFAAKNCHSGQHEVVLQVMREVQRQAQSGQIEPIRQLSYELAHWFPQHAQHMDGALASHLQDIGFDTVRGSLPDSKRLPEQEIRGCGGASCTPQHEAHSTSA